jgi:hypothetical protein
VCGKTSWVYVQVDDEHELSGSTSWIAVKVKLPRKR